MRDQEDMEDLAYEQKQWLSEMQSLMTELEKKQASEKAKLSRKHRHELKEEKIKSDTKNHLAL